MKIIAALTNSKSVEWQYPAQGTVGAPGTRVRQQWQQMDIYIVLFR